MRFAFTVICLWSLWVPKTGATEPNLRFQIRSLRVYSEIYEQTKPHSVDGLVTGGSTFIYVPSSDNRIQPVARIFGTEVTRVLSLKIESCTPDGGRDPFCQHLIQTPFYRYSSISNFVLSRLKPQFPLSTFKPESYLRVSVIEETGWFFSTETVLKTEEIRVSSIAATKQMIVNVRSQKENCPRTHGADSKNLSLRSCEVSAILEIEIN